MSSSSLRKLESNLYICIENFTLSFGYSDIGNPNAAEMRKDLAGYDNFTAPGVEMHCLYGKNTGDTVDEYASIILYYIFPED